MFSAGKSSVAWQLADTVPGAFVLDPEPIGALLRDRLVPPALYPGDYQELELWRSFTRDAVLDAAQRYDGPIVVPMTIANEQYFAEIVKAIAAQVPLDHFTLMASRDELLRRERERPDDTGGWAAQTVDRVLPELGRPLYAQHVETEGRSPESIAAGIREQLGRGWPAGSGQLPVVVRVRRAALPPRQIGRPHRVHDRPVTAGGAPLRPPPPEAQRLDRHARDPDRR